MKVLLLLVVLSIAITGCSLKGKVAQERTPEVIEVTKEVIVYVTATPTSEPQQIADAEYHPDASRLSATPIQLPSPTPDGLPLPADDNQNIVESPSFTMNASSLNANMVGNATPLLPPRTGNDYDVIILKDSGSTVDVFVRNNSTQAVTIDQVDVVVRDGNGSLLGIEDEIMFYPNSVDVGEVAYGKFYFGDLVRPSNVNYEFEVFASRLDASPYYADLQVQEYALVQDRFVGMLYNPYNQSVHSYIEAQVLCFDSYGKFLDDYDEFSPKDVIDPLGAIPFQIEIRNECPTFLLFARGSLN